MTTKNRDDQIPLARCSVCDHDLVVKGKKGWVYCTNKACRHYVKNPHPTPHDPNPGKKG